MSLKEVMAVFPQNTIFFETLCSCGVHLMVCVQYIAIYLVKWSVTVQYLSSSQGRPPPATTIPGHICIAPYYGIRDHRATEEYWDPHTATTACLHLLHTGILGHFSALFYSPHQQTCRNAMQFDQNASSDQNVSCKLFSSLSAFASVLGWGHSS